MRETGKEVIDGVLLSISDGVILNKELIIKRPFYTPDSIKNRSPLF